MTSQRRAALKRALNLEIFTIAWNVAEAFIAIGIGMYYDSIALVAFGSDSMIEVAAAGILAWRLVAEYRGDASAAGDIERVERKASYWVGITFFALAAYVTYESVENLLSGTQAHPGFWGMLLAAVSAVVMPVLWRMKLKVADELGSAALRSEAAETIICTYLSVILLAGILLNYLFGLWWADSVAALGMIYFIVKEGFEAIEESRGGCCCGKICDSKDD